MESIPSETPIKPARPYVAGIAFFALMIVLCGGWGYIGYQLIFLNHLIIQWQRLPPPPSPIVELLHPWGRVRVLSEDGNIYSHTGSSQDWFISEYEPDESTIESYNFTCTAEDIPFSFSILRPPSMEKCYRFSLTPHAGSSYVVIDDQTYIWVWVTTFDMYSGFCCLIGVIVSGLLFSPLISRAVVKRFIRTR